MKIQKRKREKTQGTSLIEVVFVMAIMSLFSVSLALSFQSFSSGLYGLQAEEVLRASLQKIQGKVITQEYESASVVFSLQTPTLYQFHTVYSGNEYQKQRRASDFLVNTLTPPSSSQNGNITLEWELPEKEIAGEKKALFSVLSKNRGVYELFSDASSALFSPLHEYDEYVFQLSDQAASHIAEERRLVFFHEKNRQKDSDRYLALTALSVKDVHDTWVPVLDSVSIEFLAPYGKPRITTSSLETFLGVSVTLSKDGSSHTITYEL
jgi:type II secretory pathway pseudopilin PulG